MKYWGSIRGVAISGLVGALIFLGFILLSFPHGNGSKITEVVSTQRVSQCEGGKKHSSECWFALIDDSLKREGVSASLETLARLYAQEPDFAGICHGASHKIGAGAYVLFSEGKPVDVTNKISYCGYGFYHGFMEALLADTGDVFKAQAFCTHISKEFKNIGQNVEGPCYHGIGHGVVDGSDPTTRGKPLMMVKPGLDLCRKVAPNELMLDRCATGVFNSLAILYHDPKYSWDIDRKDPFHVCAQFEDSIFRRACYKQFDTIVLTSEKDFFTALHIAEKIPNAMDAQAAILGIASYEAYFVHKESDFSLVIQTCKSLEEKFQNTCLFEYSEGLMEFGFPGKELQNAVLFCGRRELTINQATTCRRIVNEYGT